MKLIKIDQVLEKERVNWTKKLFSYINNRNRETFKKVSHTAMYKMAREQFERRAEQQFGKTQKNNVEYTHIFFIYLIYVRFIHK